MYKMFSQLVNRSRIHQYGDYGENNYCLRWNRYKIREDTLHPVSNITPIHIMQCFNPKNLPLPVVMWRGKLRHSTSILNYFPGSTWQSWRMRPLCASRWFVKVVSASWLSTDIQCTRRRRVDTGWSVGWWHGTVQASCKSKAADTTHYKDPIVE